jgi:hypothetical protein
MNAIREMIAEEKGYHHSMSGLYAGLGWLIVWTAILLSNAIIII